MQDKVKAWIATILKLPQVAKTQPHAAYSVFVQRVSGQWTFFLYTKPDISSFLQPLEDAIRLQFITSITGPDSISDIKRDFLLFQHALVVLIPNPITLAIQADHQARILEQNCEVCRVVSVQF
ncbi:hypothetical protein EMCRGX_G024220 [Ephydatia muelleri]